MMTAEQEEALLEFMTTPDRLQINTLKSLEEMAELSEVLLKRLTKGADNQPPIEKVVEEVGDVFFRLAVLIKQLEIEDLVIERAEQKEEQVYEWYQERIKEKAV